MTVKTNKVSLGTSGSYGGTAEIWTDNGFTLKLKDTSTGGAGVTLNELKNSIGAHSISSHSDMGTDFAPQYYNQARLNAALASAAVGNLVGISGDVGGNTTLGAHVADSDIHQRLPKFVLRVAKGGQAYQSIQAALEAIPASGADAPSASQRWRIEVSPGAYDEAVLLDKQWVDIVGAGVGSTVIRYSTATQWPLRVAASNVSVSGVSVETTNSTTDAAYALVVGQVDSPLSLTGIMISECAFKSMGKSAAYIGAGVAVAFWRADFTTTSGNTIYCTPSSAAFEYCSFIGGIFSALECVAGAISVVNCTSSGQLLQLNGGTVLVRSCRPTSFGGSTALRVGSGGSVYWDGYGFVGTPTSLLSFAGMAIDGNLAVGGGVEVQGGITADGAVAADSFSGDGGNLSGLNAGALESGTVPDARLSSNIPRLNAAAVEFSGDELIATGVIADSFEGSGSALTGLNASALASGTVPDARLASTVARKNQANTWTGESIMTGVRFNVREVSPASSPASLTTDDYMVWTHPGGGTPGPITINLPPDGQFGVIMGKMLVIQGITNNYDTTIHSPNAVPFRIAGAPYVSGGGDFVLSGAVGRTLFLIKSYNEWRGWIVEP